jgi:hypothetical protein
MENKSKSQSYVPKWAIASGFVALILAFVGGFYVSKNKPSTTPSPLLSVSSISSTNASPKTSPTQSPLATPSSTLNTSVTPSSSPSSPAISFDSSIKDLMPDVACRTKFMSEGETNFVGESSASKVTYFDFNSDNVLDAAVDLTREGTGQYGEVCIYTVKNKVLSLLWRLPSSDVLSKARTLSLSKNTYTYNGVNPAFNGPTATAVPDFSVTYSWNGNTFIKQ